MHATKHEHYMQLALEQARIAYSQGEVPIGAIIVQHDIVIAKAYNQTEQLQQPLAHAEKLAIEQAAIYVNSRRLTDCALYVTLEPCAMCAGAIILSRIPKVFYASYDPKAGAVTSLYTLLEDMRLNHRCEVHQGIMANESSQLLSTFFKELREGRIVKTRSIGLNNEL
jgi:tRNA(adenine34) deaminase